MKKNGLIVVCLIIWCCPNTDAQFNLRKLATPFSSYTVSSTNCSKIIHSTGSIIYIPENAFQLPNPAPDSVTIFYREFHSPVDMVTRELSMLTELMNKSYLLESSGMFEIYAMNGKESIQVHEDRSIFVRMAVKANLTDPRMEAFSYNEEKGIWESYNRIAISALNSDDDDLWGSSSVQSFSAWNEEEMWMSGADSLKQQAFQSMEIFDFGLYNYDKIIQGATYANVQAEFVSSEGQPIGSKVYVVYKDINSVVYFMPNQWEEFWLIKDKEYTIFSISDQGVIAKLGDFPDLNTIENQQHQFILKIEGKNPENRQELAKMTNLR